MTVRFVILSKGFDILSIVIGHFVKCTIDKMTNHL